MIRKLIPNDAIDYRDLRLLSLQTDPQSFASELKSELKKSPSSFESKIIFYTQKPSFGIYGSFSSKRLCSYLIFSKNELSKMSHLSNLYEIYTHPDFRHLNKASKLIQHVTDLARKNPALEQLVLNVNSDNHPAIKLYQKLGFVQVGNLPNFIKHSPTFYSNQLTFVFKL